MKPGEYEDLTVPSAAIAAYVAELIRDTRESETHASFAQLGVGGCACGTNTFCTTEPAFTFIIPLTRILKLADRLQEIAEGFDPMYDGSSWEVTFQSEDDPIADILYRVLRDICGCEEGADTDAYYPDPALWH
jgi:hypothetical protein